MMQRELLGFGAIVLIAAVAPSYAILIVLMVGVGAGNTSFKTTSNALVLLRSAPDMRGHVLAIHTLLSQGLDASRQPRHRRHLRASRSPDRLGCWRSICAPRVPRDDPHAQIGNR